MKAPITILNRLSRADSATHLDVWYKTIIRDSEYSLEKVTDISGSTISMGQTFVILIPFTGRYIPYSQWKNDDKRDSTYTMSVGDYIFINNILDENVNTSNIQSIRNKYEPMVCEVKVIKEVAKNGLATIQLRVEGV